jgi:nucleoside 2-deoxyribosyltransferase
MNIYFACSITGGRELEGMYQAIVRALTEAGHLVPTAHLAEADVLAVEGRLEPAEVYARDTTWLRDCNLLIAEISLPSHGVGYEIGFALALGKPVLALYQEGRTISKMVRGNPDPNLSLSCYKTPEDAVGEVQKFLNKHKLCL